MISIIIPTYNEENELPKLLQHLQHYGEADVEIIVVDGGSLDDTGKVAKAHNVKFLLSPEKGRGSQMNFGADNALGEILYFVHADTLPPNGFVKDIHSAINEGFKLGRYCSAYQSKRLLLKLNELLSGVDSFVGMGGDQTLFISKQLFNSCGGFKPEMKIMEEFDFCQRARKLGKYKVIRKPVLISARKYENNSWLTVQKANFKVFRMYSAGASQDELVATYRKMLKF